MANLISLSETPHVLDDIDVQLLAELQNEGKASLASLGERVGLSAPAVMERVRKLEQAGVIRGYTALVDARQLGLDVTAFIGVSINYPRQIDRFEQWVASEPRVLECHHITGGHTLLLKVKCPNTAALESLISTIRAMESVDRTETMVVLSTKAERTQVPLDHIVTHEAARPRRRRTRQSA